MDWGKMKQKLSGVFGGSSKEATPETATPVALIVQQMQSADYRQFSPKEIGDLVKHLRQIKDICQTNALVFDSLSKATPKVNDAEVEAFCQTMRDSGIQGLDSSQTVLGDVVLWANQLETTQRNVAKTYQASRQDAYLPVVDAERTVAIGIAEAASGVSTAMLLLQAQVLKAEAYLNIPQLARIKTEFSQNSEKLLPLIDGMAQIALDTLGKKSAASPVTPAP